MKRNKLSEAQEVAYGGERVTHLYPNDCYFAHLSIYNFALPFAREKVILDAGCGSGYGSAYLAENGAVSVDAVDISPIAIEFNKKHFQHTNLRYQAMSLEKLKGFQQSSFDLIYSSNVLEHVPHVEKFFASSTRLLKQNGVLLIAVPPVVDDVSRNNNIINPYHLNIWTPRQWYSVLSKYYQKIEAFYHTFDHPEIQLDFSNTPEQTRVRETDFTFRKVSLDDFYSEAPLTVVFLAQEPKKRLFPFWNKTTFVEDSYTRPQELDEPSTFDVVRDLVSHAFNVAREHGISEMVQRTKKYFQKDGPPNS